MLLMEWFNAGEEWHQSKAKSAIHDMHMAATKEDALKAYDHFIETYEAKYPKAVECLKKDKEDFHAILQLHSGFFRYLFSIDFL